MYAVFIPGCSIAVVADAIVRLRPDIGRLLVLIDDKGAIVFLEEIPFRVVAAIAESIVQRIKAAVITAQVSHDIMIILGGTMLKPPVCLGIIRRTLFINQRDVASQQITACI